MCGGGCGGGGQGAVTVDTVLRVQVCVWSNCLDTVLRMHVGVGGGQGAVTVDTVLRVCVCVLGGGGGGGQ